jgi:hypothetical protein
MKTIMRIISYQKVLPNKTDDEIFFYFTTFNQWQYHLELNLNEFFCILNCMANFLWQETSDLMNKLAILQVVLNYAQEILTTVLKKYVLDMKTLQKKNLENKIPITFLIQWSSVITNSVVNEHSFITNRFWVKLVILVHKLTRL